MLEGNHLGVKIILSKLHEQLKVISCFIYSHALLNDRDALCEVLGNFVIV